MSNKMNKFEDYHYKGISSLQRYYAKRLKSSNEINKELIMTKLRFLKKMKDKQFYNTKEQKMLNSMRKHYHEDLMEYGKGFEGMDLPFGPKVTMIS